MNEDKIVPLGCAALFVFSMSISIAFNLNSELGAVIFIGGILIWLFLAQKREDQKRTWNG